MVYGFRLGEERFFHANAATLPARAHRTVAHNKKWSLLVYRHTMRGGTRYRLLCTRPMASKLLESDTWETQKKYTWKGYKPTLDEIKWVPGDEGRLAQMVNEDINGG